MKRNFSLVATVLLSLFLLVGCSPTKGTQTTAAPLGAQVTYSRTEVITSSDQAKQLLVDGNTRFASGKILAKDFSSTRRNDLIKNGQHPFAVVVCCSDSRVPPEELFDQALGDLFIIRVAGNVITPVELGSVEYGVEHLKSPLVIVLGHEKCGAVTATVAGGEMPGSIGAIANKIKPAVAKAKTTGVKGDELIEKSADLNVQNALADISNSPIIKHAKSNNQIKLLGAKYHLDTGLVHWFN
ncbi:MAG: carbonic anhydrase [Desulfosporosinus sp. BRH_c37]|nr:MAG: carbonic anhydrase [Desulfosporosinus sp. BRH_c37]